VRRAFPEARSDAQCAIQFVRSTRNVTSAVVGMREPDHIRENLALTREPPADPENPLDRWILSEAEHLVDEVTSQLDAYDLQRAIDPIVNFIDLLNKMGFE